jgi:hypothetical protein
MSTKTRAERADVEPREPRCRICRRSDVRRLVNDLLGWRGVPVILEGGNKRRRITYTDILGMLEPLNEGRDKRDVITYNSLDSRQASLRPCRDNGLLESQNAEGTDESTRGITSVGPIDMATNK